MKTRNANADTSTNSLLVAKVNNKYFNHFYFGMDIETSDIDYQITRKVQLTRWAINRGYSINEISFVVIKTNNYDYNMYKALINNKLV